jgi:hypothetical protein
MKTHQITIDMDKRCTQCKNGGATPSGLCLPCVSKNLKDGKYDHIIKRGKPMPKITEVTLNKIADMARDALITYQEQIDAAYLAAGDDPLTISIKTKIKPADNNRTEVSVGISFSTGRVKDEFTEFVDESQMNMFDREKDTRE